MSFTAQYSLAFVAPLVVTLILTPAAVRLAHRIGVVARPRHDRLHLAPTPYLGGVAVAAGFLIVASVPAGVTKEVATVLFGSVLLGAVGLWDDWRGLGPLPKLAAEATAAIALWSVGVRAGFFGVPGLDLLVTIGWVVLVTNAVNILDNADGIASGVVAICAVGFFVIAARDGNFLVASLALGIAGASVGFLRYNFPPARIFLGDAGTLMMGFLLAAIGLKLDLPIWPENAVRTAVPLLALAVPLFDVVLVVVSRMRAHRPVHRGGTDHSAHRLLAHGYSPRRVTLTAYATQLVCSALAIALTEAPDQAVLVATVVAGGAACAAWGIFLRMEPLAAAPEWGAVVARDWVEFDRWRGRAARCSQVLPGPVPGSSRCGSDPSSRKP